MSEITVQELHLKLYGGDRWKDDHGDIGELSGRLTRLEAAIEAIPETIRKEQKKMLTNWRTTIAFVVLLANFIWSILK